MENKIKLCLGACFGDVNKYVISKIDADDLSKKNVIIVPDRYSLLIEKTIFKVLGRECVFNVEVMGVSRFANRVFKSIGVSEETVSKQEGLLLVKKSLLNLNKELTCYRGKNNNGLCEEIYSTIAQLKANEICPESLATSYDGADEITAQRVKEVSQIYKEYERLLGGKLDSSNILTALSVGLAQFDLKNYNFYYLGFDSLTKQGFTILKKLIESANSVTFGAVSASVAQKNSYIFENDLLDKIYALQTENGFLIEVQNVASGLNEKQKHLQKNLFALKCDEIANEEFAKIIEVENVSNEVENLAKEIKRLVFNGVRFKDINVACCGLEAYTQEIEKVFGAYGITYFSDENEKITETEPIKYLLALLKIFSREGLASDVENLVNSPLTEVEEIEKITLLNFIGKYALRPDFIFNEIKEKNIEEIKNKIFKNNLENIILFKKCKKYINFINFLKILIKNNLIIEKINNLIIKFRNENNLKLEKVYMQLEKKIDAVLESIEKILGEENCDYEEFVLLFETALKNIGVNSIPISTDCVFVGDVHQSYFQETDYLFVLGANQGALPFSINDNGILNDDVLEKIADKAVVEPSVRMINRRTRFKAFLNLLSARKNLIVFYHLTTNGGQKLLPSVVVGDINKMFNLKNKKFQPDNLMQEIVENQDIFAAADDFAFYLGTRNNARHEILKTDFIADNLSPEIISSLAKSQEFVFENYDYLKNTDLQNIKALCFKNSHTTVSQIEKYFSCPFKQFSMYGLRLKEREVALLQPNDTGEFLHKVAQEFLEPKNNYIEQILLGEVLLENVVKNIIANIKNDETFYKYNLKINKAAITLIEDESMRFCKYLYATSLKSDFKPAYLEARFGDKRFAPFEIKVLDEKFTVTGVVDRVDVFNDFFTVIDYKTGKVTSADLQSLYYGEKVQIYVYMQVLKQLLKKKPAGVYYFPISNKFADIDGGKINPYKMVGKSLNYQPVLRALDKSLTLANPKSDILQLQISTKKANVEAGILEYSKGAGSAVYVESPEYFEKVGIYAFQTSTSALGEIIEGNIKPSPWVGACKYCPFKTLCLYDENQGQRNKIYEFDEAVKTNILNKIKEGGDKD